MDDESPSKTIDAIFADLDDWRGVALRRLRVLIKLADSDVVEELKWKKPTNPTGVPVWSDNGLICTGEIYKSHVKLTFARGASLVDPHNLFNASRDGNLRRAIDIREHEEVDEVAFKDLFKEAVELNRSAGPRR